MEGNGGDAVSEYKSCAEMAIEQLNEHANRIAKANRVRFMLNICLMDGSNYGISVWKDWTQRVAAHRAATLTEAATECESRLESGCKELGYDYVP
jgi:hypothetical protein